MMPSQVEVIRKKEIMKRAIEISEYKNKLKQFNIDINDLPQITPSSIESRKKAINIAKHLAEDRKTVKSIKTNHSIPSDKMKEIQSICPQHVEYITAITIIFTSEFKMLTSFLQESENES